MDVHELTNTAEIFEILGGIRRVAEITESAYGTAANWKAFNAFPARTYLALTAALKARGYTAPPALWGMVPSSSEAAQ